MANWAHVAIVCGLVGYDADVLGILSYQLWSGTWGQTTVALFIVAFILYTISAVLLVLNKFAGLKFERVSSVVTIVFMLAAGTLLNVCLIYIVLKRLLPEVEETVRLYLPGTSSCHPNATHAHAESLAADTAQTRFIRRMRDFSAIG